jgi:Na+/proline symporter/signal transduction histidine kinase
MSFELGHLFFAGVIYLLLLFFIAYATEQGWISRRIVRHPLTYTLSLGVYATSWTFYGSVGFAKTQGFNFLTIYVGVTLAFALSPLLLAPILRVARDYQLTSLADVFAFRYRSQLAGVLVTLFMLCGAFPYIALQILAVTESLQILTRQATPQVLALGFCVTLTAFAILFGARHISPREKHEGLVVAIAFESLVKLSALCAVGLFAVYGYFGGFSGMNGWLDAHPEALEALYAPVHDAPWTTFLLLAFCAAFMLPRQFHMAFTENIRGGSLLVAAWAFPLFLLLLNLFIPAILWAGNELLAGSNPDYYVLGITLWSGNRVLPTFAFIGGVSAASAMMIVTTLALSSMCLNHLLLPARYPDPGTDLYKWLLWGRRTMIAVIILASYGFYLVLEHNSGLVQLGLISFVAVAQFLPGVIGLLYWPRATRAGFVSGLVSGMGVWAVTLMLPLLQRSGIVSEHLELVRLVATAEGASNPWFFSTFTALALNTLLFVGVSLLTKPSDEELDAADACRMSAVTMPSGVVLGASSPAQFKDQLARILGSQAADSEVRQALRDLDMAESEEDPRELRRLRERIERNLSGLMGPMIARMIVDERLQMDPDARTALADNIRFIEERLERSQMRLQGLAAELDSLRRYHQQILRDLPLGVCSVSPDTKVVSWNMAMQVLARVDSRIARGRRINRLPEPWAELFSRLLEGDDNHLHKVQVMANGVPRWFNLHKAAIADPSAPERAGGTVILVEDLTDLQTLEAELAHSERLASVGRLAAGIAHEIGNPVTGIACLVQNLRSETADASARETSAQILEQTQRITDIVQSLVKFSHSGSIADGTFVPVVLHECVDEAARLVRLSRAGKQIACRNECPPELEIFGDRPRILQVFVNLLTNACDASTPGSTVTVRARRARDAVRVDIVDHGEGVPGELLGKVFEPFVTTKPPGRGTGLGLALVYRIVQDHRGSISIDSEPGQGTRVSINLPRAASSAPEIATIRQVRSP